MCIGKCCRRNIACLCRSIFRNTYFFPGVNDQSTVLVFWKIRSAVCPGITCIQLDRVIVGAILLENNIDLDRAQTILVITVVPVLRNRYGGRFRNVLIRNRREAACFGS